jgi:hypothetical protein
MFANITPVESPLKRKTNVGGPLSFKRDTGVIYLFTV